MQYMIGFHSYFSFRCLTKYIGSRCEMIDPEIIFEQYESKLFD